MDGHFDYAVQDDGSVLLATLFTRSSQTPNNNNSYMQGGFAVAKLTAKGVDLTAPMVELPQLQGERAFMRPQPLAIKQGGVTKWLLIAASEDNGVNNNPQPVAYIADKTTGALQKITNSTRGNNLNKPTNLIQQALKDGINVNNPNNQRGPHTIQKINNNTFVVQKVREDFHPRRRFYARKDLTLFQSALSVDDHQRGCVVSATDGLDRNRQRGLAAGYDNLDKSVRAGIKDHARIRHVGFNLSATAPLVHTDSYVRELFHIGMGLSAYF